MVSSGCFDWVDVGSSPSADIIHENRIYQNIEFMSEMVRFADESDLGADKKTLHT